MTDNPLGAALTIVALWPIIIGIMSFCALIAIFVIVGRLGRIADSLSRINDCVFRTAHPEIPWPPLGDNVIVHYATHEKIPYRMFADGRWESSGGYRWEPTPPPV